MGMISLNVLQTHIDTSNEFVSDGLWSEQCPLALVAKTKIPNFSHVSEKAVVIVDKDTQKMFFADLPKEGRDFTRKADVQRAVRAGILKADPNDVDQEPLKPINVSVYVPDHFLK